MIQGVSSNKGDTSVERVCFLNQQKISVTESALQSHATLIIFSIAEHCFQFQNRMFWCMNTVHDVKFE